MNNSLVISRKKQNERKSEIIARWIIRVLLVIWSMLIIFPLFWAIITSFKSQKDFMAGAFLWPSEFLFSNYIEAWKGAAFSRYFFNSVFLTIGTVLITVLMTLGSSYVIAKYKSKFIRFLDQFYAIFMMVPQLLLLIPLLKFCQQLRLTEGAKVLPTLMVLNAIQGVPFIYF